MLDIVAICLVVTALLAYLNHRFLRLPTTIGVMVTALGLSLAIVGLDKLGVAHGLHVAEERLVNSINFSEVLLQGMLSLLLFAGAMHVDSRKLKAYQTQIISLAVLSTAASTLLIGFAMWKLPSTLSASLPIVMLVLNATDAALP